MAGRIVSINLSEKKGTRKTPVESATVIKGIGFDGDAHASGTYKRQISLLAIESINKMTEKGVKVGPGDFAENLTTEGLDLPSLPVGTRLLMGGLVEVEVSQIGKTCHSRCAIYEQAGYCVMPEEGIFVSVLTGGILNKGDDVKII